LRESEPEAEEANKLKDFQQYSIEKEKNGYVEDQSKTSTAVQAKQKA
jgi:hypothetical protein